MTALPLAERDLDTAPRPPFGELLPANRFVLREARATAVTDAGDALNERHLDLDINAGTGEPVIYCRETDRYWTLSWRDMIHAAATLGLTTKEAS